LTDQKVNVEASASYLVATAKVKTSYEKQQEEKLKSAISSWTSFSIGAAPDPSNDALKWAARTVSDPMPVYINLVTMADFLRIYGSPAKIGTD
jgi:hypothetical protein